VVPVAADASAPGHRDRARRLAAELGLPFAERPEEIAAAGADVVLVVAAGGLELRDAAEPAAPGVRVDFRSIERGAGRRQPLPRAIGAGRPTVLDATAGLGGDAALLAILGYEVTAVERSPVVFALLRDGVTRAGRDPRLAAALGGRLRLIRADARVVLGDAVPAPDVVYIDPMFPPKRKASALAKKGIRAVRAVVGDDADAADLLDAALGRAGRRVVVKRPRHAAPIGPAPVSTVRGKLVRYDLYAPRPA
jgi:16S rRNA (guanine1516-N2)-methyltransferase